MSQIETSTTHVMSEKATHQTSVFILQYRPQSGFKRRPRPAEPKVPGYVNRIRRFFYLTKLTQVISTKHIFK